MAITIIPMKIQRAWEVWNLRGALLASLFCQILLICCASLRKRTASYGVYIAVWSAYLLADWVAAFAVGLISSSQGEKCEKVAVNDALVAFWAPFLLLHLGGPDTITAFALQDNELWLRHLLGLMVQLLAVAYVFSQSIPNDFWIPTVLMFFAGTIKYAERLRALYLACLRNFKHSWRPEPSSRINYTQLTVEWDSKQKANVPAYIYKVLEAELIGRSFEVVNFSEPSSMDEIQIIKKGYRFFTIFKGLIVDQMFSLYECKDSRNFFLSLKPHEAFRVMEVELNFLFDALFTKMGVVHKAIGYIFRFTCTALIVAAFVLFTMHDKRNIHRFDIGVTQALLVGAICLDFVALIKLIFSDWTIAILGHLNTHYHLKQKAELFVLTIHRRISSSNRWSKSMYQHSLISYCLKKQSRLLDIADFLGFKEILEEMLYKREQKVTDQLVEFIFGELKGKALPAKDTTDTKEISYSYTRDDWPMRIQVVNGRFPVSTESRVSGDVDYDQSVLTWHIATELCFFTTSDTNDERRKVCKLLSDYSLYLLIMQPLMMSAVVGIAPIRFQDICEEARELFSRSHLKLIDEKEACEELLKQEWDKSNSVLFDACTLAKKLKDKGTRMWEIMSKVWLVLLCYGASHCRGDAHAQQLSKGGELVTFVWLLMAHFRLGDHFKLQAILPRLKLLVEK